MNTYVDSRGSLTSIAVPFNVKEILFSCNGVNVLRGLHLSPYAKRVLVKSGKIYDFCINPDTLERVEATLTRGEHIDVPAGWAHGFYSIEPSELIYLLGGAFDVTLDRTIYWDDPALPLSRNFPQDSLIMSKKDTDAKYSIQYDFLVLGARGFLGSNCVRSLRAQGFKVFESNARLGSPLIREQIVKSSARFVVCAAGISGKPTIDWCEQNEAETYESNYVGVVNLLSLTLSLNVHTTIFGSGLIYSGTKAVYTEDDVGDNNKKVYSKWRIELEKVIPMYPNALYLRILYPVTLDGHPKCFLTKMLGRAHSVHPIKVPLTVVPDMFPKISLLCIAKACGIYNFVNEGTISLVRMLKIYSEKRETIEVNVSTEGEARGGYELSVTKLSSIAETRSVEDALLASF
jgi:3,5-epimerase/4-reductase